MSHFKRLYVCTFLWPYAANSYPEIVHCGLIGLLPEVPPSALMLSPRSGHYGLFGGPPCKVLQVLALCPLGCFGVVLPFCNPLLRLGLGALRFVSLELALAGSGICRAAILGCLEFDQHEISSELDTSSVRRG